MQLRLHMNDDYAMHLHTGTSESADLPLAWIEQVAEMNHDDLKMNDTELQEEHHHIMETRLAILCGMDSLPRSKWRWRWRRRIGRLSN